MPAVYTYSECMIESLLGTEIAPGVPGAPRVFGVFKVSGVWTKWTEEIIGLNGLSGVSGLCGVSELSGLVQVAGIAGIATTSTPHGEDVFLDVQHRFHGSRELLSCQRPESACPARVSSFGFRLSVVNCRREVVFISATEVRRVR
jgi:hypothetical protein